jgi:Asp-tRNA(Asn)/Glu-tRNA(Gln) amidotransferase A subunit family amidase
VQGAICREVRDVRLATRVMAARDARDPWWVPAPFDGEPLPAPIRVAVTRNAHGYPMHADIDRALEQAAGWLAAAGYAVEEVEPPPITEPARAWFSVAVAEMKVLLFPTARQHGSKTIQDIFDWYEQLANAVDAQGYMLGVAERTRMTRQWSVFLEEHPLVLTPFFMRPCTRGTTMRRASRRPRTCSTPPSTATASTTWAARRRGPCGLVEGYPPACRSWAGGSGGPDPRRDGGGRSPGRRAHPNALGARVTRPRQRVVAEVAEKARRILYLRTLRTSPGAAARIGAPA